MVTRLIKQSLDFSVALTVLLVLSPVLLLLSIMLYFRMSRTIMFMQQRPGKNGKIFTLYKFCSMTNERDQAGNILPDAQRLTKLGQFIRKTSLDELPQLWNVVKGDMSLVGPRPLLVEYLDRYTPEQSLRHAVKPGITGLAQTNGRNSLSWEEKFKLDIWYVEHWSLWLDLKILGLTVVKVVQRDGISQTNQATMSPFEGTLD